MRRLKKPPRWLRLDNADAVDSSGSIRKWGSTKATIEFRKNLTLWLTKKQGGRCAYCSLPTGVFYSRSKALDHFIPKGKKNGVARWTFELYNLILACEHCNSKLKKQFNPLLTSSTISYKKAEFSIFHPYLDRLSDHLEGGYSGGCHSPSVPKALSPKGEETIRLFDLNSVSRLAVWEGVAETYRTERRKRGWSKEQVDLFESAKGEMGGRIT